MSLKKDPVFIGVGLFFAGVAVAFGIWLYGELTEPDHGVVYKKGYTAGYYSSSCNKDGSCTATWVPPCYEIDYKLADAKGDACVAPEEYMTYKVGDYYPHE